MTPRKSGDEWWNRRGPGSVQAPMTKTVPLPPMRSAGPIEVSRDVYRDHVTYGRLLADAATTGRCPVWITDRGLESLQPGWDHIPVLADLAGRDATAVLAEQWPGRCVPP